MSNSNPNHTPYFFIFIFIFILSFRSTHSIQNHPTSCHKIEQQSLLNFKQSLQDPDNLLSSWDANLDCCKWRGVVCSNSTGHVHQLHLQNKPPLQGLSGKLNPSLLSLKHLTYLDLSLNKFGQTIPSFIGSLSKLEYMNFSDSGFHGIIPHSVGNLSNLHTLSLGGYGRVVASDNLVWLSSLSRLEYLNMNYVDLSKVDNLLEVIESLPSLLELHLKNCSLDFIYDVHDNDNDNRHVNDSSLTYLDLSHNNFHSLIPRWVFSLQNLVFLDLSYNYFNGPIPTVNHATKLNYIDLSKNPLNSTIPDWLYSCKDLEFVHFSYSNLHGTISKNISNLTSLKTLDFFGNNLSGTIPKQISNICGLEFLFLTYNELQGELSDSFGSMSDCFSDSMILLCLRSNHLHGPIPDKFGEFKKIQYLHFGANSFSGPIPDSLGKLSSLEEFSLYGNNFSGSIPESFGNLYSLEEIYLDDCKLEGIVTEKHFTNLTKLKIFSAPGNNLELRVRPNWVPPFQLLALKLGSWRLGSESVPLWIDTQRNVVELDLSSSGINGVVPSWIWQVKFLNLSHNSLYGEIPNVNRAQYLYLGSNRFSGLLPRVGESLKELDLSNNSFFGDITSFLCENILEASGVEVLHLAGNKLSGEIPNCWMKLPFLKYLNLGSNDLFGNIPNSMGYLANLQSLNLYNNKISGLIPSSLHNCTELVKIELSENDLDGNLPSWIGISLTKLKILILRSNKFSGKVSPTICHLTSLQILDLSDNRFSGVIPTCVGNFTAMATVRSLDQSDFSSNYSGASFIDSALVATKGSILQYDTILSLVTSVDLSNNNLSGPIPDGFTRLSELRSLNLSLNSLSGLIPKEIGDMKELESLDLSRNSLYGEIPSSFSLMPSLSHLNLSYNELSGRIPKGTQIQSLDGSSFSGNDLCGPPLIKDCSDGVGEEKEEKDDDDGVKWFYVFLSCGYAVGMGGVCATLLLNKSWRDAYFALVFKKHV